MTSRLTNSGQTELAQPMRKPKQEQCFPNLKLFSSLPEIVNMWANPEKLSHLDLKKGLSLEKQSHRCQCGLYVAHTSEVTQTGAGMQENTVLCKQGSGAEPKRSYY